MAKKIKDLGMTEAEAEKNITMEMIAYLKFYKIQLREYKCRGKEEFSHQTIPLCRQSKERIDAEINNIDFFLNTYYNYRDSIIK